MPDITADTQPAAEPVEPTTALPPLGFAWVNRMTPRSVVAVEPIPLAILAGLPDGAVEQIPVTEGLTANLLRPKSRWQR